MKEIFFKQNKDLAGNKLISSEYYLRRNLYKDFSKKINELNFGCYK